jgi:hypothetical protein
MKIRSRTRTVPFRFGTESPPWCCSPLYEDASRQVGAQYELNGVPVRFRGDNIQGADYDSIKNAKDSSDAYDLFPGFLPPSANNAMVTANVAAPSSGMTEKPSRCSSFGSLVSATSSGVEGEG